MGTLKRINKTLPMMVYVGALATVALINSHKPTVHNALSAYDLPRVEVQSQLFQAAELSHKAVTNWRLFNNGQDLRPYILSNVQSALKKQDKARAFEIARAVIVEANHHAMDPLFLLAVIKTESKFDLRVRGRHGEIGLMQVLPKTAEWLAVQAGLGSSGKLNLEDPVTNIRIGATYFAHLRRSFKGQVFRYVGAYNMGAANVRRLVAARIEPKEYASRVLANYNSYYRHLDRAMNSGLVRVPTRRVATR